MAQNASYDSLWQTSLPGKLIFMSFQQIAHQALSRGVGALARVGDKRFLQPAECHSPDLNSVLAQAVQNPKEKKTAPTISA
jgi:hypothetical protein